MNKNEKTYLPSNISSSTREHMPTPCVPTEVSTPTALAPHIAILPEVRDGGLRRNGPPPLRYYLSNHLPYIHPDSHWPGHDEQVTWYGICEVDSSIAKQGDINLSYDAGAVSIVISQL